MKINQLCKHLSKWGAAVLCCLLIQTTHAQIADGRYNIVSRHSGLALDVAANSQDDGANIQQWSLGSGLNQRFDVTNLGNGNYSIRPAHSGKSLDVFNFSTEPGGEIRQWAYLSGSNQQWQIENVGSGYYKIVSAFSGLALDVWEWSSQNGGDIRQWTDTGGTNQQWNFQLVAAAGSSSSAPGSGGSNLGANLSLTGPGAGADGSGFSNTKLVRDGSTDTYTQASGTSNQRVSVKWSSAQSFNTVILRESGNNVSSWQLVNNQTGSVLASGTTIGSERVVNLGQVSMNKINLVVSGSSPLRMAEFEVYNAGGTTPPSSSSSSSSSSSGGGGDNGGGGSSDTAACLSNPIGYASLGGGTTGGAGGTTVTVTNGAQLVSALSNKGSQPLTIRVNGTLTLGNSGGVNKFDIKDMNDVSIIGVGTNGVLDGIGIKIWRANNVIIRNLTIRYVREGDGDGIGIEGPSSNIWIDHNTIHNSLNVDKDYYDGLVDATRDSNNITISYNHLHSSWKTALTGHSDSNSNNNRRITYAFNRWENTYSRTPLIRFNDTHVYNNYYNNVLDTGINTRMGARTRIDNNVFENSRNPIVSCYSNQIGYWDARGNIFNNVSWVSGSDCILAGGNGSTVTFNPPYTYNLLAANQVKNHVIANAGVGKCNL